MIATVFTIQSASWTAVKIQPHGQRVVPAAQNMPALMRSGPSSALLIASSSYLSKRATRGACRAMRTRELIERVDCEADFFHANCRGAAPAFDAPRDLILPRNVRETALRHSGAHDEL
jgi:hypothetical protein